MVIQLIMPIDILGNEIFTQTLVGSGSSEVLTITESDGVGSVSVFSTTGTGTILGTGVVGGNSSEAINVAEGNSITISAQNKSLGSLTITAPDGVTLIVIANKG